MPRTTREGGRHRFWARESFNDLILRSRAQHGASKDFPYAAACGRPSRRAQKRAPQDEVWKRFSNSQSAIITEIVQTANPPVLDIRVYARISLDMRMRP